MSDPVTAADGHVYEKENIEKYIADALKRDGRRGHVKSPITNELLKHTELAPAYLVRGQIEAWTKKHGGPQVAQDPSD